MRFGHSKARARGFTLWCLVAWGVVFGSLAEAQEYRYDPDADPVAAFQLATQQAGQQHKLVLLVFGSEWCPDCRSLNKKMALQPFSQTLQDHFLAVHVDIGNWDRNMAFTRQFGEPVAKGIPSIAVVAPDEQVLYVSEAGEFASARNMGLSALDGWMQELLIEIGRK
jgi:thiol-disulfide isomerase/thioredoxin